MSSQSRSRLSRGLSQERIVSRILVSAESPKLQSELLNALLISRSTLSRYVTLLVSQGLLEQVELDGRIRLKTTSKGREFLRKGSSLSTNAVKQTNQCTEENEDREREGEDQSRKSEFRSAKWDLTSSII